MLNVEHLRPLVVKVEAKLGPCEELYVLRDLLHGVAMAERKRCLDLVENSECECKRVGGCYDVPCTEAWIARKIREG